jgi:hypothetical protein
VGGGFMAEKIKIVEIERIDGNVIVTFSDGRITTLGPNDIHSTSVEPSSKYPPAEAE